MLLIVVCLTLVALLCALLYINEKKLAFAKNIPEIYGMPFFGVTFDVFGMDSKRKNVNKFCKNDDKLINSFNYTEAYTAIEKLIMPYDEKICKRIILFQFVIKNN